MKVFTSCLHFLFFINTVACFKLRAYSSVRSFKLSSDQLSNSPSSSFPPDSTVPLAPPKNIFAVIKDVCKYSIGQLRGLKSKLPKPVINALNSIDKYIESKNLKAKFTKEEISKLGMYALLSYGFVSNFSYITCVIIAWCIHGKTTGDK